MSKGNMLLGHARGKVGSLVFSRANGQQITRARAEQVKNPQTQAQTIQRILLNTVAQAYSKMSSITDHSFEGVKPGQDSMSYFMKRNLNYIRAILVEENDFTYRDPEVCPIGKAILCSNRYEISKGSLPAVNPTAVGTDGIAMYVPANTYKSIIEYFGLQRGDQLTFCIADGTSADDMAFHYARVILDPKNEDGTDAPLTTALADSESIVKPNPKNEINDFSIKWNGTGIKAGTPGHAIIGCVIASRQKEDGTWLRSNSTMIENGGHGFGVSMQDALDEFYSENLEVVNPRFLNNANKGFKKQQAGLRHYNVSVLASPSAAGEVTGAGRYVEGTDVTVTATASEGYRFLRWTENNVEVSTDATFSFNVTRQRSLVAVFQSVVTVAVTTSSSPAAGGNTSGGGNIPQGDSCTVVATPNAGYKFKRWTKNGAQVSTSASYTFTANEAQALVAEFEEVVTVAIATSSSPAAGGTTSGGGNIEQGTSCTIVATPASGYQFVKWTENGADVSTQASYTFTANAAHNFVAVFEEHSSGIATAKINNVNWSANETSLSSGDTVSGTTDGLNNGAKIALVQSSTAPEFVPGDGLSGDDIVSNGAFSLNARNITGQATYWLCHVTGDPSDGYVVQSYWPYTAKGAGMAID